MSPRISSTLPAKQLMKRILSDSSLLPSWLRHPNDVVEVVLESSNTIAVVWMTDVELGGHADD